MTYIQELGQRAKEVSKTIGNACTKRKNEALEAIAEKLWENRSYILEENARDIENAQKNGMNAGLIDRLTLTENGISGICEAVRKLIALDDPVGITESGTVRPNGLRIYKTRVALGVVGIIFESRPNVTVDGAILCLKSGNAVILRGGKEAIFSNKALAYVMRQAVMLAGLPEDIIQLVEDSSRETANEMMKLNEYLDVLIPRGGAGLIHAVVENATVPVIETGVGNCHIYVEKSADLQMAANIVENAKTSRVSVCNSEESLLVDESIAKEFLPLIKSRLDQYHVKWYGCDKTRAIIPVSPATDEEYGKEFLDYAISVKVVQGVSEAISHIDRFGTGHSEGIVTNNLSAAEKFMNEVDAAAVYVNASTRFTDGGEFGFGAEIGISTQKLHARGPMGLKELTSIKYKIYGDGQIRE